MFPGCYQKAGTGSYFTVYFSPLGLLVGFMDYEYGMLN